MKEYAGTIKEWQVHTAPDSSETVVSGYCVEDKTVREYIAEQPCHTYPLTYLDLEAGRVESARWHFLLEGKRGAGRAFPADMDYHHVLFKTAPEPDRNGYGN